MALRLHVVRQMNLRCAAVSAGIAVAMSALLGARALSPGAAAKSPPEPAKRQEAPSERAGTTQPSSARDPAVAAKTTAFANQERVQTPEDKAIFRHCLEAIEDRSVSRGEASQGKRGPSTPEPTSRSVEPYPKDVGTIRIDSIVAYAPSGAASNPAEGMAGQPDIAPASGPTTPGGPGIGGDLRRFQPPQEGQEGAALFVLSSRLAKERARRRLRLRISRPGPVISH